MNRLFASLLFSLLLTTSYAEVTITRREGAHVLLRDGQPYEVKGVGGQQHLALAAGAGANSTRTWGSEKAIEVLDEAASLGMTATIGFWLDHDAARYRDEDYKARIRKEVTELVATIRNHPALLLYGLGNEINLGADTPEAWSFVNELAGIVKRGDPAHPVMTVLAGTSVETIRRVTQHAPSVDVIGFNSYRGLDGLPDAVAKSGYTGPYLVTEWGPHGHWEVAKTSWDAPLEQTSAEKAATYAASHNLIAAQRDQCLGSYVFFWGQKQERTPTWYGIFVEDRPVLGLKGESTAVLDVMTKAWSGKEPANRAPQVTGLEVEGSDGKELDIGTADSFSARLRADDPDGDTLVIVWEIMAEATRLGSGGSFEPRPASFPEAIQENGDTAVTVAMSRPGLYRLFAYALDGKGKVGTTNLPFRVR